MASARASELHPELAETEADRAMLEAVADVVDSVARLLHLVPRRPSRREVLASARQWAETMAGAHTARGERVLTEDEMRDEVKRRFPGDEVAQAIALDAFTTASRRVAS